MNNKTNVVVIFSVCLCFVLLAATWRYFDSEQSALDPVESAEVSADPENKLKAESGLRTWSVDQDSAEQNPVSPGLNNSELAKAHYEVADDGNIVLPTNKPMSFTKLFTFPGGEVVEIEYTVEDRFNEPIPEALASPQTSEDLQKVRDRALAGDAQAAMIAFDQVQHCLSIPDALRPIQLHSLCDKLDDVSLAEARALLKAAADLGNDAAQLKFAQTTLNDDPAVSQEYFMKLWEKGFSWGLGGLVQTSPDWADMTYEEQIDSEVLAFVNYAVTAAYLDGVPDRQIEERVAHLAAEQEQRLLFLPPAVHRLAVNRAKVILESNAKCCRVFTSDSLFE